MSFSDEDAGGFMMETLPEDVCLISSSESGWAELRKCRLNGKFVVLKSLKAEFRGNPMYENLLRKEFSLSYDLDHQSICRAYDFRRMPSLGNCIVMQWVDGDSLRDALPLHDRELSEKIAMELCDALEYMHSRQIVHRDLKPENVIITHNGHNVKLIDFGLSDSDDYAVLKAPAGTRLYASPEVLAGKSADCRSDIWSLGMILSELDGMPRRVVRRCLRKNPEKRYQSVAEVRKALTAARHSFRRVFRLSMAAAVLLSACALLSNYIHDRTFPEREFRKVTDSILDTSGIND